MPAAPLIARAELRLGEGQFENYLTNIIGDAVPDVLRMPLATLEAIGTAGRVTFIPSVERRLRNADLVERGAIVRKDGGASACRSVPQHR